MAAPKKSLRPRARPKNLNKSIYGVEEGSTSSPDGVYVTERDEADAVSRGNREAKRRTEDTQKFMMGGEVRQGFAEGGEVRNNTAKYGRKTKKKLPKTPKMPKDPKTPTSMGDKKLFQLPYKRKISKKLGTKELPVGKPVPDSMLPPMLSRGSRKNFEGSFRSGGEVRVADVRDNPKRGKCY